jgi:plastocyanin
VSLAARRRRATVLAGAIGCALLGVLAAPAMGDDHDAGVAADGPVVEVGAGGENRYSPEDVTVEAGEPVTFVWVGGGHSVTHRADDPAFDSHPDCREGRVLDVPRDCGAPGTSEEVVLDEAGTYEFGCRIHDGMTGTITVEEASAEEDGTESAEKSANESDGDPEAGESGGGSDDEGAAGDGSGNGEAGASSAEAPEAPAGSEDDGEGDAERQQAAEALAGFSAERSTPSDIGAVRPDDDLRQTGDFGSLPDPQVGEPDDADGPGSILQSLPRPDDEPDLEPFPDAERPSTDDEVALPAQDGGDRTVPIALASVGVLGTGAAVVRQVLAGA